ncbi:hypothetical protein J4Q44_G00111190 [Coregonus suidteri]|uniref:Solute carrier family 25 member 3 n=1 Tax=Coregonus suidteri TaxID=861788 RepID=A0AAN8LVH5_9TELE
MAEFLEDPSVLTKDKLKSELTANNVLLPSSEQKKDVYSPTRADLEEKLPGRQTSLAQKKWKSQTSPMQVLKDELLKHGVKTLGPIVELLLQAKADGNQNGNTHSGQYSDKEEGISASCRRPIRGAAGRPVKPSDYWLNESLLERSIYTESYSECSSLGSNAPARPGFLSVLLKLMVLITVAGSIYFAIQHLDADQVQSFKGLLTDAKGLLNSAKGHLCSTVDKVVDAVCSLAPLERRLDIHDGLYDSRVVKDGGAIFATESLEPPLRNNVPQRVDTVGAGEPLQRAAVHSTKSRGAITKPCCRTWTKQTHIGCRCSGRGGQFCEFGSRKYYALCGFGGILSCGITHTAVVPLDLVKCRLQVDPDKYKSIFKGFSITIKEDGMRGLAKGWAPTFIGYSMQGLCKFGFYEVFKITYSDMIGEENTYLWRTSLYLAASASAEFFADIALAPMEACKVRIQTQPGYANNLRQCAPKMFAEEGLWATVELLYKHVVPKPRAECSKGEQLVVTFTAGYIAGVFCAIVSHPADSVVSVLNKESGSTAIGVLKKLGPKGVWKGLVARIIMIGTLTALQWFIYDSVKVYFRLPRPPPPEMPESLKKKLGITE